MYASETKTIFVLLTERKDRFSRMCRRASQSQFTHASIGLEDQKRRFYSFLTKGGFRTESPQISAKLGAGDSQCALYKIEVAEAAYMEIKNHINTIRESARLYKYSYLGALLCFLRVPHKFKRKYFCSQFIAELLISSKAADLKKRPSIFRPDDFMCEPRFQLCYKGALMNLAVEI